MNMAPKPDPSLVVDADEFLSPPSEPILRDHQLREIRASFTGELAKTRPLHCWIYGPPGSGKTLCVQHLLRKEVPKAGALPIYVDCRGRFSFLSVVEAILDIVRPLRNQQRTRERQLSILNQALTDRSSVVTLDDIDVLPAPELADLVHHLASLPRTSLVCISASRRPLLRLEGHARSRLAPRQILFPRYQPGEIHKILEAKAQRALAEGAWTAEVLHEIGDHAYGDARRAIALLRHMVQRAEEAGATAIGPEHLVRENFDHFTHEIEDQLAALGSHHQLLYDLAQAKGPLPGPVLEEAYESACERRSQQPVSSRTLNKYLAQLCTQGILTRERGAGTSGWIYGVRKSGAP